MTMSNETCDNIDEAVERAAMPSVLNLRNVFELVNHTLNDRALVQGQFVDERQEAVLHVLLQSRDKLNVEGFQQLLEQRLRNVSPFGNELAK